MPKVTFKGRENLVSIIPAGDYIWEVESHELKMSPKNSNEYIRLKLIEIKTGCVAYDNLFFTEKAAWRIDTFLRAAGLAPAIGQDVDFTDEFCMRRVNGARFWASCTHIKGEKDPNKTFMEISSYLTNKPVPERNLAPAPQAAKAAPAREVAPDPDWTN